MIGELLISIVGFFRWVFKGCRTELKSEIQGKRHSSENIRGKNYLIGVLIFTIIIILLTRL
jgi:hypothetical protein